MITVKSHSYRLLLIACCALFNASAQAADASSKWQLSLAAGAGIRTNPVMDNDNIPLLVIPRLSYQGERFFIQNLDVGYTLLEREDWQLNVLLTPSYDHVFFNKAKINNLIEAPEFVVDSVFKENLMAAKVTGPDLDQPRLHKRYMAGLAGLEYSQSRYGLDFQVQLLTEATGYYDGGEVRFSMTKAIHFTRADIKLTLGTNWQDSKTLNYYYGLNAQETLSHSTYSAGDGIATLLRFDWNYQLDEHWSLCFFSSYRHLSHSISASPLVTASHITTAFAGGVYHF